uniref:Conotoxin superfamily F n=1 Tax=Conus magus TaxID=6492 RepID=A0A5P8I0L0_CONMA|nr:conotoxin superfamily F [Conus magus]
MQRGAVLLGVVAFLALWPQAAAEKYDLHDSDVWAVVAYSQSLMNACATANDYMDNPWSLMNIADFKERSTYYSMYTEMVTCLNYFLQRRL